MTTRGRSSVALLVLRHFLRVDHGGLITLVAEWPSCAPPSSSPRAAVLHARLCRAPTKRVDLGGAAGGVRSPREAVGLTAPGRVVTPMPPGSSATTGACIGRLPGALPGGKRRHRPKLTAVAAHLIAGAAISRRTSEDSAQLPEALGQAARLLAPGTLLADAGYNTEHNHQRCRLSGIGRSVIYFNPRNAGQRWPLTPERCGLLWHSRRALYRQR